MYTFTEREKHLIEILDHPIYTVPFLEKWVNRTDNMITNAPSALQIMGARGYYQAVKRLAILLRGDIRICRNINCNLGEISVNE